MKAHKYLLSCAIVSFVLANAPAWAQSQEAQNPAPQSVTEIIVTAQKRAERLEDVPISIVTQTGEQLARAGVTNTRDLAAVTPGLTFSTTGGWSQPSLRGVSSTSTNPGAESPVAIYLDGIYQPSQNGQIFDLPDIARVEVLKGPQGTLFGRNATAGAIQIFTRDPEYRVTGQVTATAGLYTGGNARTAGEYGIKGFISLPIIDQQLAASLSGNYTYNSGYFRNIARGDARGGKVKSGLLRGKLLFEPSSSIKFVGTAYYSDRDDAATEAGSIPNGQSAAFDVPGAIVPTRPWTFAYDDPRPLYTARSWGLSLRGDIDLEDIGTITTLTGYSNLKSHARVDVDGGFVSGDAAERLALCPGCTAYRVSNPDRAFSQEINFASEQFGILRATAGLAYFNDDAEQIGNANDGAFAYTNEVKTRAAAVFAELTLEPVTGLSLIGGLRYNHETKTGYGAYFTAEPVKFVKRTYNSTTPRASIRYEIAPRTNIFFTYSKGFKSGVLPNTCFLPTCPVADPEKLTAYEGGIKRGGRDLSFSLTAFHYDYSDLQVLVFDGLASNTENAASAKITGFDADATALVADGLSLRAGVSWLPTAKFDSYPNAAVFFVPTPTIDASGTRLLRAPRITGTASIDYTGNAFGGTLEANASLAYSSSYRWDVTNATRTKEYATLGVRLGFQPEESPLKFIVFGRNLTNAAYIQGTLLSASSSLAFYAPPRQIGLQIEYGF